MSNAEAQFNNSLRPRKPEGSLGRTAQDGHLDSHSSWTIPEPLSMSTLCASFCCCCCRQIADNIFHLDVHYVCYTIPVQRFEPQGRRFTNLHYYCPIKDLYPWDNFDDFFWGKLAAPEPRHQASAANRFLTTAEVSEKTAAAVRLNWQAKESILTSAPSLRRTLCRFCYDRFNTHRT